MTGPAIPPVAVGSGSSPAAPGRVPAAAEKNSARTSAETGGGQIPAAVAPPRRHGFTAAWRQAVDRGQTAASSPDVKPDAGARRSDRTKDAAVGVSKRRPRRRAEPAIAPTLHRGPEAQSAVRTSAAAPPAAGASASSGPEATPATPPEAAATGERLADVHSRAGVDPKQGASARREAAATAVPPAVSSPDVRSRPSPGTSAASREPAAGSALTGSARTMAAGPAAHRPAGREHAVTIAAAVPTDAPLPKSPSGVRHSGARPDAVRAPGATVPATVGETPAAVTGPVAGHAHDGGLKTLRPHVGQVVRGAAGTAAPASGPGAGATRGGNGGGSAVRTTPSATSAAPVRFLFPPRWRVRTLGEGVLHIVPPGGEGSVTAALEERAGRWAVTLTLSPAFAAHNPAVTAQAAPILKAALEASQVPAASVQIVNAFAGQAAAGGNPSGGGGRSPAASASSGDRVGPAVPEQAAEAAVGDGGIDLRL